MAVVLRSVALGLLVCATLLAACGSPTPPPGPPAPPTPRASPSPEVASSPVPVPPVVASSPLPLISALPAVSPVASPPSLAMISGKDAADVRVALDRLFQEHVLLVGPLLEATVAERHEEQTAAGATLDRNSQVLSQWLGAVYGLDAQRSFLELWRARIGLFTSYAQSAAANDAARRQQLQRDLGNNSRSLAATLAAAGPGLDQEDLATRLTSQGDAVLHAGDALAARDAAAMGRALDDAAGQSVSVADRLVFAMMAQYSSRFLGPVDRDDVQLRANLALLIQEHVYRLEMTLNASANGRPDTAGALARATDDNLVQLANAIGSAYGPATGQKALDLWRAQVNDFDAFADASANGDAARKAAARAALDGWRGDMDALLAGINPLLPEGRMGGLLKVPLLHMAGAAENLAGKRWTDGYAQVYEAAHDMEPFADALAQATSDRFPSRFGTASNGAASTTQGSGPGAVGTSAPAAVPAIGVGPAAATPPAGGGQGSSQATPAATAAANAGQPAPAGAPMAIPTTAPAAPAQPAPVVVPTAALPSIALTPIAIPTAIIPQIGLPPTPQATSSASGAGSQGGSGRPTPSGP